MTYDTARAIWIDLSRTSRVELKDQLIHAAVTYARIRSDWRLARPDERAAMNARRTAAHDALIDACNILSRAMAATGESVAWRERLGTDRKEIGDFACFVHAFVGIEAR